MKILHINSYFSTSGLFSQLYHRQVDEGHQIKVYVPIAKQFPQDRLAVSGDYTDCVRIFNQIDRFIFPIKHQKILKDMLNRYQLEDFDLIHAHSLFSNGWLAYQAHLKTGLPYLVAVRNADIHTFFQKMPWMRSTGIKILKAADKIIFISRNSYQEVLNHFIPDDFKADFIRKTQVIPNGIDEYWHNHVYTDKEFKVHHPLKIVSTGKVMGLKRFIQLADMVASYNQECGLAELYIIGPDWNPKIRKKLEEHPYVHYLGPKSKEDILDIYRTMDIFALLSAPETFGLVYAEAMSQGLPLIYTKGQGFDGFFENYHVGISVDKTDQEAFVHALDYIKDHYPVLSQTAMREIQSFKWDDIHQIYQGLYLSILKEDTIAKS